jgi:hypothetical protein
MPRFSVGCKPDPPHVRARNALVGSRPLRARFSVVEAPRYPVACAGWVLLDQGSTESCTAHALANGVQIAQVLDFFPSPRAIYALERMIERAGTKNGALPDDGAVPSDGIVALQTWGVVPFGSLGDVPGLTDVTPENVSQALNLRDLEAAAQTLLIGAHPLPSEGDALADDIAVALGAGAAVFVAVPGSAPAFQNYTGGLLEAINLHAHAPDHAVLLVGAASAEEYVLLNSWGPTWGEAGLARVSRRFVEESTVDRYAISVRRA